MKLKKIGLALGGGGARGYAHIGILKVLERNKIPIDYISGTSMGGLLAALYCGGYSVAQLEDEAIKFSNIRELMKLVELAPPRRGFIDHRKIRLYLAELLGDVTTFSHCCIPLGLCAIDLQSGREVHLTTGELIPAILSTICFPGIFPPVDMDGQKLIDGGILNNVPVNIVKNFGAEYIIAVDVEPTRFLKTNIKSINQNIFGGFPTPGAFLDFYYSELLMISKITEINLQQCKPDCLINPQIPLDITELFGFFRANEIIEIGEKSAQEAIPKIIKEITINELRDKESLKD
jgi:NTE family protein